MGRRPFRNQVWLIFALPLVIGALFGDLAQSLAADRPPNVPRGSVCLVEALEQLQEPSVPGMSRSAELEIGAHYVWPYLTTEDGTLAPLVKNYGDAWFSRRFPGKSPGEVRWSSLTPETQRQILNDATQGQKFFKERKILGLTLNAPKGTPLSEFQPYVELGDPSDAGAIVSLELHLRSQRSASHVARATREASRALGREKQHLHVHIPMPLNRAKLEADPFVESVKMHDFYRRTELYSQMVSVMETQVNLSRNSDGAVVHFGPLTAETFRSNLYQTLYSAFYREVLDRKVFSKGFVGIRGEGFYDQPSLWGIEVRAIHKSIPDSLMASMLDGFESTSRKSDLGLEEEHIRKWMEAAGIETDRQKIEQLGYSPLRGIAKEVQTRTLVKDPLDDISVEDVFPDIGSSITERGRKAVRDYLVKYRKADGGNSAPQSELMQVLSLGSFRKKYPQMQLLLQPWETDPLFYNQPERILRIQEAKLSVFRKLMRDDPPQEVIREFLIDSGIYDAMGKSLGIRLEVIPNT